MERRPRREDPLYVLIPLKSQVLVFRHKGPGEKPDPVARSAANPHRARQSPDHVPEELQRCMRVVYVPFTKRCFRHKPFQGDGGPNNTSYWVGKCHKFISYLDS